MIFSIIGVTISPARKKGDNQMKSFNFKALKEYFMLTIGTLITTTGVYFFKIPNGFSTGGVTGVATILGKITPLITSGTWITIFNVALLFIGFIFLGKKTGLRTVYCSLLLSGLSMLFERLFPMKKPFTSDPFLELIYAMMLTSIGAAILFHYRGSSGGTDILALILKKYTSLNEGKALLCVDAAIAVSSIFVFGVRIGLYSILGLFTKAYLVDIVIEAIDSCKYFTIITSNPDTINDYILKTLNHSATVVHSKGAYSGEEKTMLHTVCRRQEAIMLQKKIKEIDKDAFIIITTSSEIIGHRFRSV